MAIADGVVDDKTQQNVHDSVETYNAYGFVQMPFGCLKLQLYVAPCSLLLHAANHLLTEGVEVNVVDDKVVWLRLLVIVQVESMAYERVHLGGGLLDDAQSANGFVCVRMLKKLPNTNESIGYRRLHFP